MYMNKKNQFEGILSLPKSGSPILWSIPFDTSKPYYRLNYKLVKQFHLVNGARICCEINGNRVGRIQSICGLNPAKFHQRSRFESLVPTSPNQRFDLSQSPYPALRIIDKFAPIGKGSRALIVSPPKAGKTTLLENLAKELVDNNPQLRVIALLIDELPEEITAFQMQTNALVYHSSMDMGTKSHTDLSDLLIKHLRLEVECGNDVVILLDSLTRLGRAYNLSERSSRGRTMSGGLGSAALELPRKFFGLARNVEGGGSCTILATILKDTGSQMDEVIFQEFKGTGNCDIILDRELAEQRIFPAIDIQQSGTRKDELLHGETDLQEINSLRRKLLKMGKAAAIESLR